ncbi:YjgN family protein [Magnetococcus sp. PR-3]|uniref:YjgN family protein n=1 Tax=Magnetococcus sp. PR-3 TaxID=3120355 RepID=UPI002FCE1064
MFTARARDYFKIWIVNWALTILTLGIYSAWAKVRRNRFFYNHTIIDGHNLEYTADPIRILKGRIIAAAFVIPMVVLEQMQDLQLKLISNAIYFMILMLLPAVIVMAMRFSLRNTEYRGIRFNFEGKMGKSYLVYMLWTIIGSVSMGLLFPIAYKKQTEYLLVNSHFGQSPFQAKPPLLDRHFYGVFLLFFLEMAVLSGGLLALNSLLSDISTEFPIEYTFIFSAIPFVLFVAFFIAVTSVFRAAVFELVWSQTHLSTLSFSCDLSKSRIFWIALSNLFLRVISLGFLSPLATIRMKKYMLSSIQVETTATAKNHFLADNRDNQSGSTAEGLDDLVGFDFGI